MKPIRTLLFLSGILITMATYGDVIFPNTHSVDKCITITNLAEYPDISLLGIIYELQGNIGEAYVINSDDCLHRGYRMCKFEIYAVRNDYLAGRNLIETDWANNVNALLTNIPIEPYAGSVPDANPLRHIEEYYKIAGFTSGAIVLYKWKEIRMFNNGIADSVKTFDYDGNLQVLSQQIPTGIQKPNLYGDIRVYPNPARGILNVSSLNRFNFNGDVKIELFNLKGKLLKIFLLADVANNAGYTMNISKLPEGLYFLKIHLGESTEVRKVILE